MAYRNLRETYTYRDPDFLVELKNGTTLPEKDHTPEMEEIVRRSEWVFQKHYTDDLDDAFTQQAFKSKTKVDPRAVREARKRGEEYVPEVEQERTGSLKRIVLAGMTVSWDGPEFEIPAGEDDPHAGETAPCDDHYLVVLFSPMKLDEVYTHMMAVWAGRTKDEQATFRPGNRSVDRPDAGEPAARPADES